MVNKVDLSKPDITKDEISNVIEVLESGWLAPENIITYLKIL